MLKLKELIDKQSTDEKIKSLINSAKNLEQNGDFVTALKFYSESLKLNPGNYDVKKSISVLNEKIKNKDNNLEKLLTKNNEEYSSEIKSEKNAAINSLNFQSEGVSELLD
jgi:tetratricopeptide (TPR) repeat protein